MRGGGPPLCRLGQGQPYATTQKRARRVRILADIPQSQFTRRQAIVDKDDLVIDWPCRLHMYRLPVAMRLQDIELGNAKPDLPREIGKALRAALRVVPADISTMESILPQGCLHRDDVPVKRRNRVESAIVSDG